MENHAEYQSSSGTALAKDVPDDVLALVAKHNPEIANDLQRLQPLRKARFVPPRYPEDKLADDYTWLWDFEHQGQKLTAKEINFIILYARQGFESLSVAVKEAELANSANPWLRPVVNAALHQATKGMVKQWQCNAAKVGRVLFNMLDARLTDFLDISPQGIVVKDLSQVDPDKLDALQEIHETRNHQGVQIRAKLYDKTAVANILLKVLDAFPKETIKVEVTGLEERLATAIQRMRQEPVDIEGELVTDEC